MKILCTGGAGFIGSHLVDRLISQGHQVNVIDDFSTGKEANLSNCRNWGTRHGNPAIYRGNCRDTYPDHALWDASRGCEFVYHLAATVGVKRVLENPSACIENNVESTREVLALGIPGIFFSTSEVFGKADGPLREDSPILYSGEKRWSYAASKLIGEWMARQAGWRVVRLFNVVGPRQSNEYGAVLPQFVRQALLGEPITVYGDGKQIRTFLDVRDCAKILDQIRDSKFEILNIAGTRILSIRELAEEIQKIIVTPSPIIHVPYSSAYGDGFEECLCRIPDLGQLNNLLPDRPWSSFQQTVIDLIGTLDLKKTEVLSHG